MVSVERTAPGEGTQNILLDRLDARDRALVTPHAREVLLRCGTEVMSRDALADHVFFPRSAVVALEDDLGLGRRIEIATIGREGMVGWAALLGGERSGHAARVRLRSGTLLQVPLPALRRACDASPTLHAVLLRFVHVMLVQMSRSIASGLRDSLGQRLARWLLMWHDRVGGDMLAVHHVEIAGCLGVRRASVTDQLHILEGERLVRCTRGQIVVRDRGGLESFAGDAYGLAEAQYRDLIAPFGKGPAVH